MLRLVLEQIPVNRLLAVVLLLWCTGCATSRPDCASERVVHSQKDLGEARTVQWVRRVRPYALMSELAYRGDRVSPRRKARQEEFRACLTRTGWRELTNRNDSTFTNDSASGLHYYIWQNLSLPTPQLVIAFRGTEWWDRKDWKANTRWMRPLTRSHDEYAQARAEVCRYLSERSAEAGTNLLIVTTGHSLGGGLAQAVFHASQSLPEPCRVSQCYTFDASPVTGVRRVESRETRKLAEARRMLVSRQVGEKTGDAPCPEAPDFGVVTVYQRGEILACLRAFSRPFRPPPPLISELRFNFTRRGGPFLRHRMCDLAESFCHLDADAMKVQ